MNRNLANRMVAAAIGLILISCRSAADQVPSLRTTTDTQAREPTAAAETEPVDVEAKVMAFVQCMRDQGIQYKDPLVDSQGNVQRPEFVEGFSATREELAAPYQTCSHYLEGISYSRERQDVTEQVDQLLALAACLRDKGYNVDDATAETLDQWRLDLRLNFDWHDPKAMKAYEECSKAD